jgi:hypothetical protein
VYTTAEPSLAPCTGAPVTVDAFEPGDLLGGNHTLYLCAPAHDQRRLRGYFTALTQQVLSHAFVQATRAGKPLDPPLLVVLDEAAHIAPLPELDGLAATCASHGIQLVTGSPTPTRWSTPAASSVTRRSSSPPKRGIRKVAARRRRRADRAGCCHPRT